MLNDYLNGTRCAGAMSAEEYSAMLASEREAGNEACGEEQTDGQCRTSCCPGEPEVEEDCCCKKSFRAALGLLDCEELTELLDLSMAAFVTDHYVAGAALTEAVEEEGPADNLAAPLTGTLRRFAPCTCDLLDITAALYTVPETPTGITATQVNLCDLVAVAVQLAKTEGECCLTAENVADRNFRRVKRLLARQLTPIETDEDGCGGCVCVCSDDCCCAAGIKASLAGSNLSRQVTLAAGPLLLNEVTLLGTLGNVLVLANDEDRRIYFVCATKVEFIG